MACLFPFPHRRQCTSQPASSLSSPPNSRREPPPLSHGAPPPAAALPSSPSSHCVHGQPRACPTTGLAPAQELREVMRSQPPPGGQRGAAPGAAQHGLETSLRQIQADPAGDTLPCGPPGTSHGASRAWSTIGDPAARGE
ncbi:hypothetical protein PVAP13_1NG266176 [Panicum virgatum]|uniref:Uncharacterized protein n=1 Tax=Panicum virgatum TaxID=38727 RepID=A0A8T0WYW6_PANVG|nr:hypothetical protein PVAP13_1NG266176 [Panicum virgatum]